MAARGSGRGSCRPHRWKVPGPTDEQLVCERCGRSLFWWEIPPRIELAILRGVQRRRGVGARKVFEAWFRRPKRAPGDVER